MEGELFQNEHFNIKTIHKQNKCINLRWIWGLIPKSCMRHAYNY
jgi:hypothetical protein